MVRIHPRPPSGVDNLDVHPVFDGKYYNMNTNQEYAPEDEMWGDTADDILEYNVGEINFGM